MRIVNQNNQLNVLKMGVQRNSGLGQLGVKFGLKMKELYDLIFDSVKILEIGRLLMKIDLFGLEILI